MGDNRAFIGSDNSRAMVLWMLASSRQLRRVAKKLPYHRDVIGNAIGIPSIQKIVLWIKVLRKFSCLEEVY